MGVEVTQNNGRIGVKKRTKSAVGVNVLVK